LESWLVRRNVIFVCDIAHVPQKQANAAGATVVIKAEEPTVVVGQSSISTLPSQQRAKYHTAAYAALHT